MPSTGYDNRIASGDFGHDHDDNLVAGLSYSSDNHYFCTSDHVSYSELVINESHCMLSPDTGDADSTDYLGTSESDSASVINESHCTLSPDTGDTDSTDYRGTSESEEDIDGSSVGYSFLTEYFCEGSSVTVGKAVLSVMEHCINNLTYKAIDELLKLLLHHTKQAT